MKRAIASSAPDTPTSPPGLDVLRKQLGWSETPARMYHYRDRDGYEVDIVLEAPDRSIVGIEVKATRTARANLARPLKRLARLAGDRFAGGVVLHCGESDIRHDDRIWSATIASLWQ